MLYNIAMTNFAAIKKTSHSLIPLLFFAALFLFFARPIDGITDMWWHLGTGQWIMDYAKLPSEDPFTYTTTTAPDARINLILKGYWLSQISFYLAFHFFGFKGLVILKAVIFTLIFFSLWKVLCYKGVDSFFALFLMAPTLALSGPFDDLRPELFSFLGAILVFFSLERGLNETRSENSFKRLSFAYLPLIMLLWANLHPGFIVGYAIFGIYIIGSIIEYFLQSTLSRDSLKQVVFWISSSVVASLLNPNHINALFTGLRGIKNPLTMLIVEYYPLWRYASFVDRPYLLYGFLALGVITLTSLILQRRTIKPTHLLLYAGFAAAGLIVFRFYFFFILMSLAAAGEYIAKSTRKIHLLIKTSSPFLVLVSIILIISFSFKRDNLLSSAPVSQEHLPVKAVNFMSSYGLPAPVFNPYIWGGYVSHKLYPRYKVFIDSRMIDFTVYNKYMTAMKGNTTILDEYGVNTVLCYHMHPLLNTVDKILLSLMRDDKWRLVYFDGNAVIFVRSGMANTIPVIGKDILWNFLSR